MLRNMTAEQIQKIANEVEFKTAEEAATYVKQSAIILANKETSSSDQNTAFINLYARALEYVTACGRFDDLLKNLLNEINPQQNVAIHLPPVSEEKQQPSAEEIEFPNIKAVTAFVSQMAEAVAQNKATNEMFFKYQRAETAVFKLLPEGDARSRQLKLMDDYLKIAARQAKANETLSFDSIADASKVITAKLEEGMGMPANNEQEKTPNNKYEAAISYIQKHAKNSDDFFAELTNKTLRKYDPRFTYNMPSAPPAPPELEPSQASNQQLKR